MFSSVILVVGQVMAQAVLYFLPAYVANACPVLFARFGWLSRLAVPVDGGRKMKVWRGKGGGASVRSLGSEFVFGSTKTWRGILVGVLGGGVTGFLLWGVFEGLLLGVLMGLGEGLGDLMKSFIKRRLDIKSSAPAYGLDQTSFLGALGLSMFVFVPPWEYIVAIVIVSPLIPMVANLVAYKLGWKKVWW